MKRTTDRPNKSIFLSCRAILGLGTRCSAIALASIQICDAQTAGIDFDSGGPFTETSFLSVPATGSKDYQVTHNGVTFTIDGGRSGGLSVGYGVDSTKTGPEYGFGWQISEAINEHVLIIKTCWGGKSLKDDFRPPRAVQKRGGEVGIFYNEIFNVLRDVLGDIDSYVLAYAGQSYQFVGFGWHQGWNDRVNQKAVDEYEENLVDLINDVRAELGMPGLPFVVANTGIGGPS